MKRFIVAKDQWDKEFKEGKWDFLESKTEELTRYAIIGMLCNKHFKSAKILDVGCGQANLVNYLSEQNLEHYLGIDVSIEATKKAVKKGVKVVNVDFTKFNAQQKFDIIILNEVLYYLDIELAIEKIKSSIEANGIIIISLYIFTNWLDYKLWKRIKKHFKLINRIKIEGGLGKDKHCWNINVFKLN